MDELKKASSTKARTSAVNDEIQHAICRVEEMESRFEKLAQVVSELSAALDKYADAGDSLKVLDAYYGSDESSVRLPRAERTHAGNGWRQRQRLIRLLSSFSITCGKYFISS